MFHRFSTWWRALGVVLLSLATVTWPSAAQAGTTPSFTLVHQGSFTELSSKGTAHFDVTVRISPSDTKSQARLEIFPRLVDRSEITPIISGVGPSVPALSATGSFALSCLEHGSNSFAVDLFTTRPGSSRGPCGEHARHLRLACRAQQCDGVYPLRLTITTDGVATTEWSLLAIQASRVERPLQVDLVETLDPTSWRDASRSIAVLNTLALGRYRLTPITLTADYRTLDAIEQSPTTGATFRTALNRALASPLHQVVDAPPPAIDFAGLVAKGLKTQVHQQLSLSTGLLKSMTGRYAEGPLLLSGPTNASALKALAADGVSNVVLPETDLTSVPSTTLSWGAPFHPTGVPSITALSTDDPLSVLASDRSINPGLRADLVLGTLAFLHYEEPDAPAVRTVVIDAPVDTTSTVFVSDLLGGFPRDPYAQLASLAPSFSSSLVATNGAPPSRTLAPPPSPSTWSTINVTSLVTLIGAVTSYTEAVTSTTLSDALHVAVARAEVTGDPGTRQAAINAANDVLNAQLSDFTVDSSAITLTGTGTSLPITVLSRANYTVTGVVHLITDRLSFPKGENIPIVLDSPAKSIRVATSKHNGSSLTLQVVLTTPNDQVVLARAAIQVRIAGTSIVGYFLTIASLLVLAYWWLRTFRRRSKGRHAR